MEELRENIKRINERIAGAASRAGRKPEDVQLVAVTKTVETEKIREGIEAGLKVLGENRVQEAEGKILELGHGVQWHMIGHLQTNKVKKAVMLFDMIHSVDSLHLAFEIDKRSSALGKHMPILLQVDLAGEETKSGFSKEELFDALPQMAGLDHIKVWGVMTIPPFSPDPEASRPYFRELSDLREKIAGIYPEGIRMDILSMGMSQDFEVAIQEGANMVRIGTALFGPRCCKRG